MEKWVLSMRSGTGSGVVSAGVSRMKRVYPAPTFMLAPTRGKPNLETTPPMHYNTFGKTGLQVSALGFGGSEIGDPNTPQSTVEQLLNAALDAGLNTIDTGECYRESEEKIGVAISHRRADFHLFTKVGHASGLEGGDWNPAMMAQSIDRSLQRLKVDTVDLVQLHSCSKEMLEQGDVITVLQAARDAGKTRFIGYSGDRDAALYAVNSGAFDTLQTSVNIADQQCLTLTLPAAVKANMGIIAKRPVANVAWMSASEPSENDYTHTYWGRFQQLKYPFLGGDDAANIALRWTLSQSGVSTAIVGTANPARWAQNAAAVDAGPLPSELLQSIASRWAEVAPSDWVGQQ